MEYIDRIFYRKINPSDFKKLYNIDKPKSGGGQTYLEAAGISNNNIVDFLNYAEISDSPLEGEKRSIYTFNAHVLGDSSQEAFIEFAPRKGRNNYRISRQNMKYKHPAWSLQNGFPEPKKNNEGIYTSEGNFAGIIDNLLITIIRTTYKKYYAGFVNVSTMPSLWPEGIGLECLFEGERRGVLSIEDKSVQFIDNLDNPFGKVIEKPLDLHTFLSNYDHRDDNEEDCTVTDQYINYSTGLPSLFPRNRIVFGAPGTGKSFTINNERKELIGEKNEIDYERVTFHPDYSYANFVGTYKPVPGCKDEKGVETITYKYVPGPFMRLYVKALKSARSDKPKPFLLIIEEINRANVAAVFGDVFQLLDRNDENISEYPIQASEDIKKYLAEELKVSLDECSKIRIPDNMFIWATMNSADQGVFPMDTAFKRRWNFTYLGIDDNDKDIRGKYVVVGSKEQQRIEWNELRKAINEFLASEKINEDKQLGPYFIARSIVVPLDGGNEIDRDRFCDIFKHKVLMYLFEDAGKQKRNKLFEGSAKGQSRYSKICEAFDEQGIGIFHGDIQNRIKVQDIKINDHKLDGTGMVKTEE